ncbi:Peptidase M23 [Oscillochloris trichoides DG-6]|uniref:Peptidase M23 n=1 Tax=Oscillochloris trichoides DG-6 TaxID=765420 RepID=E1IG76_9CHLR|nr:C39 family peptidase [Oscillochloris trichoides]EFO79810.1 Peptidase M23 [Oscillochloris trichoides DG-6]
MRRPLLFYILFLSAICITLLNSSHRVSAAPWEQTIMPLGSGFESSYPGGWVLIRTQNTVTCSTNSTNVIYTRTRTPPNTNDSDWVRWRPTIPTTGQYQVFVYMPGYTHNTGVTTKARYQIGSATGTTTVVLNQNSGTCGWVSLGWYQFNAGTSGSVYMGDYTGDNPFQLIAADGVKFVANQPPLVPTMFSPSDGATTSSANVTLQAQDAGDPDNGPRNSRQFQFAIEQIGGSWTQTSGWGGSSWNVTLPADGQYRWRVQANDGSSSTSGWSAWRSITLNRVVITPALTRSRLYVDTRNYLMLEICGRNINQNIYIGSKRAGRDFGIVTRAVNFGSTEQCTTVENLADGAVLTSTTYQTGVALRTQDVYSVCGSSQGLCNSIQTSPATIVSPPQPPPATGTWRVPFFSQVDPRWKNKSFGNCICKIIGQCGCALTSVSMNLAYYGVDTDPARLATSMGKAACPMNWATAINYTQGKVGTVTRLNSFSWAQLEAELKKGPVILELTRSCDGVCNHFVVAVGGSGTNSNNYLVNDPGVLKGERMSLSAVLTRRSYRLTGMRIYTPGPNAQPIGMASTDTLEVQQVGTPQPPVLSASEIITGSVTLYRNTETMMTLELAAVSSAGAVTEMRIWTDNIPNETWQPYSNYVELPLSERVYVEFRDAVGNVSGVVQETNGPEYGSPEIWPVFLPVVIR